MRPQVRERVRLFGRMDRDALSVALAASRALLVPARDTPINRAKCGMKVVDSLAAGLPVIASDVGQHREYIVHGKTGLLAAPDDVTGFAAMAGLLLDSPELARKLGNAARARMRTEFTWDRWVGRVEAVYQDALSEK
jgi:glycosyltransferase involved in cell wall biosynthesis